MAPVVEVVVTADVVVTVVVVVVAATVVAVVIEHYLYDNWTRYPEELRVVWEYFVWSSVTHLEAHNQADCE